MLMGFIHGQVGKSKEVRVVGKQSVDEVNDYSKHDIYAERVLFLSKHFQHKMNHMCVEGYYSQTRRTW